jgi:hypothetical protein
VTQPTPRCTCHPVPEHLHTTHYGATEPGITLEPDPGCPVHFPGGERAAWLEEVRAREIRATEGPWAPWLDQDGAPHMHGLLMVGNTEAVMPEGEVYIEDVDVNPIAHVYTPEDREFIAHAREDVPTLLRALEAVEALHEEDLFRGHLSNGCKTCAGEWPCLTVQAIDRARATP